MFELETLILYFISSVCYWFAVKVNFHQIYQLIVQLFSGWNEFDTWESMEGRLVLFVTPDFLILVDIAAKSYCFCQPHRISITLLEEDVYYTEKFICLSLFATKVHEKYAYLRKRSFSIYYCLCVEMSRNVKGSQNQTYKICSTKRG